MSKLRRLRVQSLENLKPGEVFALPPAEAKHARVLRLKDGTAVEIADDMGRKARATLSISGAATTARIVAIQNEGPGSAGFQPANEGGQDARAPRDEGSQDGCAPRVRLKLAVAWPKGKRAALLVEKCCELGADQIMPVRYARSVVSKADGSAGLARLRRIAAAAAKQCGRAALPEITPEKELGAVLACEAPGAVAFVLEPSGQQWLPEVLAAQHEALRVRPLLLFIGPEGGFAPEELEAFRRSNVPAVRIAPAVLRIETAALAACAIAGSLNHSRL